MFRASNDANFFFNTFGQQEKWLEGALNSFNNPFYFILPNGNLVEWNGTDTATGIVIATNLPAEVYSDPQLLADAYADGMVLASAVKLNPFAPNSGGPGDRLG